MGCCRKTVTARAVRVLFCPDTFFAVVHGEVCIVAVAGVIGYVGVEYRVRAF